MTFPTEEQGREAQEKELQQTQEESEPEEPETPADSAEPPDPVFSEDKVELSGEQKVEALLSVYEGICGMMAAQVENPAMTYRNIVINAATLLPRSDMPMVYDLIDSEAASPEAIAAAKLEVMRLIILGMASADLVAPGHARTPHSRRR
jgi:hypothetical protein